MRPPHLTISLSIAMNRQAFSALVALLGLPSCMQMEPPHEVDFISEVKPLLETRCLECHQHRYGWQEWKITPS